MLPSSKSRLTVKQLENFSGRTLFDKIARAVCRAGTLPAKELYEAWETARRIRRKFRGGRVVDMAGGHGLLAHIMLLLDNSSAAAAVVDSKSPPNASHLSRSILASWPRLQGRIHYIHAAIQDFGVLPDDLVVSIHACGDLTDSILARAVNARARVAVLPCCHDLNRCPTGGLEGWLDGPLAVDVMRAARLQAAGYTVLTRTIPAEITPKNRLLMAYPIG
jgi:hypothetical protein